MESILSQKTSQRATRAGASPTNDGALRATFAVLLLAGAPQWSAAQDNCNDVLRYGISERTTMATAQFLVERRDWMCESTGRAEERYKNTAGQGQYMAIGGAGHQSAGGTTTFLSDFCSSSLLRQERALQQFIQERSAQPPAIAAWGNCMGPTLGTMTAGLKLLEEDNSRFLISIKYSPTTTRAKSSFDLDERGIVNATCVVLGDSNVGGTHEVTSAGVSIQCSKTQGSQRSSVTLIGEFARPDPPNFVVAEEPVVEEVPELRVERINWKAYRCASPSDPNTPGCSPVDATGRSVHCEAPGLSRPPVTCDWSRDLTHTGCWQAPDRMVAVCQAQYGYAEVRRGNTSAPLIHSWRHRRLGGNRMQCEIQRNGVGDYEVVNSADWVGRNGQIARSAACILANPNEVEPHQTF